MSSLRSPAAKDYVDRGVQTVTSSSAANTPRPWLARSLSGNGSLSECSYIAPIRTHSRSSSQLDSAYSHSLPSESPSPVRPATRLTRRVHKHQQTPYSRTAQKVNKRVVSLPENILYNTKALLESATLRVVSMPECLRSPYPENSLSSDSISATLHTDSSSISRDDQCSRTLRVRSPSGDAPHTPSPPSSPDSVVIIDDQDQLSETFLRGTSVSDSQQLFSDDEGALDISLLLLRQRIGSLRLDHLDDFTAETNPCSSWASFLTICSLSFVCICHFFDLSSSMLMVLQWR